MRSQHKRCSGVAVAAGDFCQAEHCRKVNSTSTKRWVRYERYGSLCASSRAAKNYRFTREKVSCYWPSSKVPYLKSGRNLYLALGICDGAILIVGICSSLMYSMPIFACQLLRISWFPRLLQGGDMTCLSSRKRKPRQEQKLQHHQ